MDKDIKAIERRSQERVRFIIDSFCEGNRMRFSKRTGIGKSSISQYVNGTNSPGSITASKIGEAFNLNPMWIMGFDVPMESHAESAFPGGPSDLLNNLINLASGMSDDGLKKLLSYAEDIKDKYQKDE